MIERSRPLYKVLIPTSLFEIVFNLLSYHKNIRIVWRDASRYSVKLCKIMHKQWKFQLCYCQILLCYGTKISEISLCYEIPSINRISDLISDRSRKRSRSEIRWIHNSKLSEKIILWKINIYFLPLSSTFWIPNNKLKTNIHVNQIFILSQTWNWIQFFMKCREETKNFLLHFSIFPVLFWTI